MNEQSKTIFITGGAGFIGSHLCEKYLREGHRVICMDNLQTTMTPKNIERFMGNPSFRFIKHDIIKPFTIEEKVDWIFNLACSGSYTSYQYDPVHTTKTNTLGMINVLDMAREHGARVLQTSTSEIYGDPDEVPQKETYRGNVSTTGPRACYDEGKRCAETLCMDYHREYGVDVKIIRIFNTYGPNMDVNDGRAITNFIINALSGRDLVIYGDGSHTRSFQYIDDLVSGIDTVIRKNDFTGPVNIGNPGEISMDDFARVILKKTKSKSIIVYKQGATDDPRRRCPDITYAKDELGWQPMVDLEEGIDKTIKYFRTVERPDKKILVFATTYWPDLGPAERALYLLSKEMPDTQFHIITTKTKKGLPSVEELGTDTVYRIGYGYWFDKYLLPILGLKKALALSQEHGYRLVWSIMASYGVFPAYVLKQMKGVNFLLTVDETEVVVKKSQKAKLLTPLINYMLQKVDSVYVSDIAVQNASTALEGIPNIDQQGGDTKSFVNKVRLKYVELINKQEKKLARPK